MSETIDFYCRDLIVFPFSTFAKRKCRNQLLNQTMPGGRVPEGKKGREGLANLACFPPRWYLIYVAVNYN